MRRHIILSAKAWVIAFALLFGSLQIGARYHATQSLDSPHNHDCAACVLASAVKTQVAVLPAVDFAPPHFVTYPAYYGQPPIWSAYQRPSPRGPPPRAPPTVLS